MTCRYNSTTLKLGRSTRGVFIAKKSFDADYLKCFLLKVNLSPELMTALIKSKAVRLSGRCLYQMVLCVSNRRISYFFASLKFHLDQFGTN